MRLSLGDRHLYNSRPNAILLLFTVTHLVKSVTRAHHTLSIHQISEDMRRLFIFLFGVLHRFQHCTGHITTGSWKGRGNQYIHFVRVLYCQLPTNGNQLPAFPLEAVPMRRLVSLMSKTSNCGVYRQ